MFYRPENGHGLPHNPFNAVVTPRPIGWISTRDSNGHDNLAPYSFFNGEKAVCDVIDCARVANAPASLECRMTQIVRIEGDTNFVVFGEVVGVHLRDDCMVDGRFDVTRYEPLSRLGYRDYTRVREVFEIIRPDD